MKKNLTILSCLVIIFAIPLYYISKQPVSAQARDYFGGKVNSVTYCTCYYDFAVVLEVDDKASNQTVKVKWSIWLSRLRANYNIWEAQVGVLGGMTRGSYSCKDTAGYYCRDSSTKPDALIDWIRGIGTTVGPMQ